MDVLGERVQQGQKWDEMLQPHSNFSDKSEEMKQNERNQFTYQNKGEIYRECFGISHTFRMLLQVEGTSQSGGQHLNTQHLFFEEFEGVRVSVHPCFRQQQSSSLMPLLNLANLFSQEERSKEHLEIEIMVAQSLIASRKFVQAIEKLRKIQSGLIQQIQARLLQPTLEIQNMTIYIEILCADCMNQHSLQAEKMESYKRIVNLSQNFQSCKPIVANNGFPRCGYQILETQIDEVLTELNPSLILIMKGALFTNLESVRIAALKHIEYILDNIGCSIGKKQILSTLTTLIKTYPKAHGCNFIVKQGAFMGGDESQFICLESFTRPTRQFAQLLRQPLDSRDSMLLGFNQNTLSAFEDAFSTSNGMSQAPMYFQNSFHHQFGAAEMQSNTIMGMAHLIDQISIFKVYKDCVRIADSSTLQLNQIQSFKNHYNHILESILQLFNSTSSFLLAEVFEKILQPTIFYGSYDTIHGLQSEQFATELRLYLIRFADRIAQINQGDLVLSAPFLNNIMKTIIPTLLITKEQIELENRQLAASE